MVSVLIGGDVCPIEDNSSYFRDGAAEELFGDVLLELQQADLSIANLECPLIEKATPIRKTGPVFGEPGACINAIKRAGLGLLGLANNHIMDHGGEGLRNTLKVCSEAGVATVGAGRNISEARKIFIRQICDVRIGVLAMAEHEFSIATETSWGANPLDAIDFVRNVREHRREIDYLIVLFHGGHEFQVPSPRLKNTCHFLIELGANAVVVQHPHSLGGLEEYLGGQIVYGQGALMMDEVAYRDTPSFHEGFLVKLSLTKDAAAAMEIIAYTQSSPVPGIRKMDPEREMEFRSRLQERSNALKNDAIVQAQWRRFCEANRHSYMSTLLGHNRWLRKLNSGGFIERCFCGEKQLLAARNMLCCETHREALETLFGERV